MTQRLFFIIMIIIITAGMARAERLNHEKKYADAWCATAKGKTEFVLRDKTRVDCLTKNYAVEFDFADKWAEAVGQALYYAIKTERQPGIVLILEHESDARFLERLKAVADKLPLKVWTMSPARPLDNP